MKYRVLSIDLDGTLLSCKKQISRQNIQALSDFIDAGGYVCFVTGRSLTSAKKVAEDFYHKTQKKIRYLACLNGTLIYDNWDQKYVQENTIDPQVANEIFDGCKNLKLGFACYTQKGMVNQTMQIYGYKGLTWLVNLFNKKTKITELKTLNLEDHIYKINILRRWSETKFIESNKFLSEAFNNKIDVSLTSPWLYEVTKHEVNKGTAVEKISQLLEIPLTEFMAFGDSANDIPMFKKVGFSIAARKKHSIVLEYANYCSEVSQKNAVADGIYRYILKSEKH